MKNKMNNNKNNKQLFFRTQNNSDFEIRAKDDEIELAEYERMVIGRPIVYESETNIGGYFREMIEKGALDEANLNDVRFLVNHDLNKIPLARSRNNTGKGKSTMLLEVDDKGLLIKVRLDTRNTEAANLVNAIERGDISGMSFQFSVDDEEWDDLESDLPLRKIKKIASVIEVSCVTFPAYEDTYIDVRNNNISAEAEIEVLEKARKRNDNNEDLEKEALELEKLKISVLF